MIHTKTSGQISRSYSLILVLLLLVFSNCKETYTPNEEEVSSILKTLSSDEMRGRQAFTPDAEMAADYIASEFEKAGLNTLPDLDSFKQSFFLKEISIAEHSVKLGNKSLEKNQFFALLNGDAINWNSGNIQTAEIKKGDNYRAKFNEFSDSDSDLLVFVDSDHTDIFGMYRNYFSRPSRSIEGDKGSNVVFILDKKSSSYSIQIEPEIQEIELTNVVGTLPGKRTNEYVLFSAHHDHIGIRNVVEGDSIANGANDDASGVTAVIELAKHFKSLGKPERTLVFVTFTAEEAGGYGSQYFSKQFNPDEIVAMFNIEMIGKPAVSGPNTAWITGYERSSFGELLSKSAEGTIYEFYPDPYPQQNLFYRSDNATLARLGVPAHSISTTPIDVDKDYHQVSDEFETIDIAHLTNTIKAIAKAARGIVSGKDTPTRVDVELVD